MEELRGVGIKTGLTVDVDRRSLLHSLHESNSLTPDLIREINSQ
jgi:hypothetical protein